VKDRKSGQPLQQCRNQPHVQAVLNVPSANTLRARRKRAMLLLRRMALKEPAGKNAHQARAKTSEVIRQEVIVVKINIISTG
jgi:hypothetical protein